METRRSWRGEPIAKRLREGLTPEARLWVERIAELGRERGEGVCLVGGLVRDLLLGAAHRDLDLTVEGDGIAFADALAAGYGGKVLRHAEFRTAVYTSVDGFEIDLVSARSEIYPQPAALPVVAPGGLEADLLRRDFAANALALRIAPGGEPELIDPFAALADLELRSLRILHEGSFVDDPTRILRGVRLEVRLGFRLDGETERLARAALSGGALDPLSGSRLRHELVLLLEERGAALAGLERLAELGLLRALDAAFAASPDWAFSVARAEERLATPWGAALAERGLRRWRALWMTLLSAIGEGDDLDGSVERIGRRLLLEGEDARVLLAFPRRLRQARAALSVRGGKPLPHQIAEALQGLPPEDLFLLRSETGAEGAPFGAAIDLYEERLRDLRPALRGIDLLEAGVPTGREVGEALRAVRQARWDGDLEEADELAFALAFLAARRDGANADDRGDRGDPERADLAPMGANSMSPMGSIRT